MKIRINHWSIGRRFAAGFAVLLALLAVVAATSLGQMSAMNRQMRGIVEKNNRNITLAHALKDDADDIALALRTLILLTDVKEVDGQLEALHAASRHAQAMESRLAEAIKGDSPDERETKLLADIRTTRELAASLVDKAAALGGAGDTPEAGHVLMSELRPLESRWRQSISALVDLEDHLNRAAYDQAQATHRSAIGVLAAVTLLSVAAGTLLAWRMTRSVIDPVTQVIDIAERVAQGDLTTAFEVKRSDELGRLLQAVNGMQERLRDLVGDIRDSSDAISVATRNIAVGNGELSHRTKLQAASLQSNASSMAGLAATVQANASSIRQADELARAAEAASSAGTKATGEMRLTMDEISTSSRRIEDIIGVIDNIAFRTNILALNAAVEASRTGAAGRGFSVVAAEVRGLAQGCAEAAGEIRRLIQSASASVASGAALVARTNDKMGEIAESTRRVVAIMSGILDATTAQALDITTLSAEVAQLDAMTHQNATLAELSATTIGRLEADAGRLLESVHAFQFEPAHAPC